MLTKALVALTPALNDVGLGLDSRHGFKALFKDGATSTYVRGILRSIASAQPLKGLQPDPSVPSAPRFACVTPSTISQYKFLEIDPWEICSLPDAGQSVYPVGSSYIFLCPSFWRGEVAPQKNTCPSVKRNQFLGRGEAVGMYLTYLVIHEMVHFYLGKASLGLYSNPPEVYPINDCVALDILDSVHNPQNYQFYVASEYSRSFCGGSSSNQTQWLSRDAPKFQILISPPSCLATAITVLCRQFSSLKLHTPSHPLLLTLKRFLR